MQTDICHPEDWMLCYIRTYLELTFTYLCLQGESDTSYGDHVPVAMDPSVEVIGDILSKLSAVQIQTIMNSVFEDMLGDVKVRY